MVGRFSVYCARKANKNMAQRTRISVRDEKETSLLFFGWMRFPIARFSRKAWEMIRCKTHGKVKCMISCGKMTEIVSWNEAFCGMFWCSLQFVLLMMARRCAKENHERWRMFNQVMAVYNPLSFAMQTELFRIKSFDLFCFSLKITYFCSGVCLYMRIVLVH